MNAMQPSLRGFAVTLLIIWTILCIAALLYSKDKDIPQWVVVAAVPAFLIEGACYIATGFTTVRARLEKLSIPVLVGGFVASALIPYIIYSAGTGVFSWRSAAIIGAMSAVPPLWYVLLGGSTLSDVGFLILMAVPKLLDTFEPLYADPVPRLHIHMLGLLMWYRTGILSVLVVRRMEGIGFSFVPRAGEWRIGIRNYLLFLPLGAALAFAIGFVRPDPIALNLRTLLVAVGTFLGVLWVLAVAEEFFFRGLLQQLLARTLGKQAAAIVLASLIFGAAHLPNWRLALLAACAGLFYGQAYSQARSIRAPMVTHALIVTTWKVFLS
jgi:membrane protease YdiL (CAAX protease family)